MESLQDKLEEKIRNEIGDLITNKDLKEMIGKGINKALFEERYEKSGSSFRPHQKKPSLVDEVVDKHLKEQMKSAIHEWLRDNPRVVEKHINEAIQKGVSNAIMKTLDYKFGQIFQHGIEQMRADGYLPYEPQNY